MKVRLIKECQRVNPNFDPRQPADEDNPVLEQIPIGTEIEDTKAWMLCLPEHMGEIRAEPIDDDAKRWVAHAMRRMNSRANIASVLAVESEAAVVATETGQDARDALLTKSE